MDGNTVVINRLPVVRRAGASSLGLSMTEAPPVRPKRLRRFRKLGRVMLNLVFVAMIAFVLIVLGPAVLGYQRYVILTGSMTGTYDRGSIVFDRPTPVSSLKVGDPITYDPPPGFTSQTRVTHRIFSIRRGPDGTRIFKTKGDANAHPDVWQFSLDQAMQDRVVFHIPEVGYVLTLLSLRNFRIVLVGVPTLIIGWIMLVKLWREGGAEARRQKLAAAGWRASIDTGTGKALPPLNVPAAERVPVLVDLGPRPIRRSSPGRNRANKRTRLDVRRPLRVGRFPAHAARSDPTPTAHPLDLSALAPGASIATLRLRVARAHTRTHCGRPSE